MRVLLVFDDEDISIASICTLTGQPCSLEENGECNCLSVGYVTKF